MAESMFNSFVTASDVLFARFQRSVGLVFVWSSYTTVSLVSVDMTADFVNFLLLYSCIGMGLHRKASALQERTLSRYTLEMRKRTFWTT